MNQRVRGFLSVTGVLAVTGAIAVGAALLPEQVGARAVSSAVANALPATLAAAVLACTGPETLVVPDGGSAVDPGAAVLVTGLLASGGESAATLRTTGGSSRTIRELSGGLPDTEVPMHAGTVQSLRTRTAGTTIAGLSTWKLGPILLTGSDQARTSVPELAAVQSSIATKGDLRGLSASRCDPTDSDVWLVGGGTEAGERLRLVLSNPTATSAVVDISVLSESGRLEAPSGIGVVVAAGGQTPLYVDALSPGRERVAIHVVARSGQVLARMHDTLLRGLVAGGVDVVAPSAEPARRQLIPGISLVNGFSKTADDPDAPGSTSVRVAVPGSEDAVVRVRLLSSVGAVDLPASSVITVPGGQVRDIPVSGVPSGTYTAVVDADVPVVAAARIGRPAAAGRKATEFAWAPSVAAIEDGGYTVLPPGTRAAVSLVAPEQESSITLTPLDARGQELEPVEVSMKAATASAFALAEQTAAFRLSAPRGGPVAASVVATAAGVSGTAIAVLGVDHARSGDSPVTAVADGQVGLD